MKKISLYVFLVLMWCNFVHASKVLYYGAYKENPDNKDYIEHLKSVESGMSWMQVWYNDKGTDDIYCKPEKLNVSIDNLRDAIKLGVKDLESKKFSSQQIEDDFTVEFILLVGLKILFPCK